MKGQAKLPSLLYPKVVAGAVRAIGIHYNRKSLCFFVHSNSCGLFTIFQPKLKLWRDLWASAVG
eukprot:scaffold16119_cov162-Amphora_coffeaeformis.AAC.12